MTILLIAYIGETFIQYYHTDHPHQELDEDMPIPRETSLPTMGPSRLISIPILGGLHHRYRRVAG